MYFISGFVFIYFISSPFSHWRGELRKERDVQTSLRDFCSSLSVGERRIRVSHLPVWLISAALNISNNFWGWEICGFLWVLGESCLNQWQRQLQLLSGLASGAKLCNFYSKIVGKFAGVDALQWLLSTLPCLQALLLGTSLPRGGKAGARGGDRLRDNVPAGIHLCTTLTAGSFSSNSSPAKRSWGDRDRWGLWKVMSPPSIRLWSLRNDPKTQRGHSWCAVLEASLAQQIFTSLLPLLMPGLC